MRTPAMALRGAALMIVAGALFLAGPLGSVTIAAASPADPDLASKIGRVMRDSRVQRARSAVVVMDATDGRELYGRYASSARTPASNTKILTAVAALHTLGPDFRFHTQVIRRGRIANGVLNGNLYLKGYGDPTARESDYQSLAKQVAGAGITEVTGKLVVDASYFDSQRYNPHWFTSYASAYYAAQTSALTVAPNADYDSGTVIVNYRPGSRGHKGKITTTPAAALKFVTIINKTTTTVRGSRDTVWVHRAYGTNRITISGHVPIGRGQSGRQVTVSRPDLYAGAVMRAELRKAQVTLAGGTTSRTTPGTQRTVLAADSSMPLKSLLKPFLKLSNNMHAEALTKTMSAENDGPGSWSDGLRYTRAYLTSLGTPMAGVKLVDGSGLTRVNKITARAMGTVLWKVRSESWFDDFYAALPVAGNTDRSVGGTLRYRMNGTRAANNAHAKTGSLTGVTALSGYVTGRDGRPYVFSMISNYTGSTPRPVENTFVVALANWDG